MAQTFIFEGKQYPIFVTEDEQGSLVQKKGTILKCPTCPNVPTFKDLSHLVTHYGSRDHLKTANETKIRHDLGVSQSIRVWRLYQLWEEKNQVWRLLIETHQRKLRKSSKGSGNPYQNSQLTENMIQEENEDSMAQFDLAIGSALTPITVPTPVPDSSQPMFPSQSRTGSRPVTYKTLPPLQDLLAQSHKSSELYPMEPHASRSYLSRPFHGSSPSAREIEKQPVLVGLSKPTFEHPIEASGNTFPVDPHAPKAKPVRQRSSKRDVDGSPVFMPSKAKIGQPHLQGKILPGMSLWNSAGWTNTTQDQYSKAAALVYYDLPFLEDGHIVDLNGKDGALARECIEDEISEKLSTSMKQQTKLSIETNPLAQQTAKSALKPTRRLKKAVSNGKLAVYHDSIPSPVAAPDLQPFHDTCDSDYPPQPQASHQPPRGLAPSSDNISRNGKSNASTIAKFDKENHIDQVSQNMAATNGVASSAVGRPLMHNMAHHTSITMDGTYRKELQLNGVHSLDQTSTTKKARIVYDGLSWDVGSRGWQGSGSGFG